MNTPNIRLKELRAELDLTQREAAALLGIKPSYYSDLENDRRKITPKFAKKLQHSFGVQSDWILSGNGEKGLLKSKQDLYPKIVPSDVPNEKLSFPSNENEGLYTPDIFNRIKSPEEQKRDAEIYEKERKKLDYIKQNITALHKTAREKIRFNELFLNQLATENPPLRDVYNFVKTIIDFQYTIDSISKSDIGKTMELFYTFLEDPYLTTELPSFNEYKQERATELEKLLPYTPIFKELAVSIRKFQRKMLEVGEQLNYTDEFLDEDI